MLDSDLADLYGVETKVLNKSVKRNISRFPQDFMFQLTKEEFNNLRFQNGTSNKEHGGRRYMFQLTEEEYSSLRSQIVTSKPMCQRPLVALWYLFAKYANNSFCPLRLLCKMVRALSDSILLPTIAQMTM